MSEEQQIQEETGSTIFDHITELKKRVGFALLILFIGTIAAYFFVQPIFDFIIAPLAKAMGEESTNRLIYTHLAEGFFTSVKLAFFTSLYLTMPLWLIQIWRFVAPGLYRNEKKAMLPFFIATPVLFYLGGALVYYLVMPFAWEFFLSFQTGFQETTLPIQLEARISDYLSLIITFIFAFGFCFELPVLLGLLGHAGIINKKQLKSGRRYAILLAFVLGAFLTPPDVISQITLAGAILILYEITILFMPQTSTKEEQAT